MATEGQERSLPPWFEKEKAFFSWQGRIWGIPHYLIGILAIAAPVIAASVKDNQGLSIFWSGVASICAGLLTFLNAGSRFTSAWRAWRLMNFAGIRYLFPDSTLTQMDLYGILEEAHRLHGSSPTAAPQLPNPNVNVPLAAPQLPNPNVNVPPAKPK